MPTTLDHLLASGQIAEPLRGLLLPAPWDLSRLHSLDLPVQTVTVESLLWILDLPWWRENDRWFVVTPNEVRADPEAHAEQWARAMATDLDHPIHLRDTERGRVIIDGVHRLLKAAVEGRTTMQARLVTDSMLDQIYVSACRG